MRLSASRIGAVGYDEGADIAPAREVFAAHLHAPGAAPVFGAQAQQGVAPLRVTGGVVRSDNYNKIDDPNHLKKFPDDNPEMYKLYRDYYKLYN